MLGYEKEREDIYKVSDKSGLRYKYKIKRSYFMHAAREVADGAIFDAVLAAFGGYDSFFIYHSFGAEADTRAIIDKLLEMGKRVYLPRVEGECMVPVRYFGKEDELVKNGYGISEPAGSASEDEKIDVCITPLLAVNKRGFRLGYGGGYYDKYFAAHANILKVGIGYFLQIADDFVEDALDERLDKFVCERGIIDFGEQN